MNSARHALPGIANGGPKERAPSVTPSRARAYLVATVVATVEETFIARGRVLDGTHRCHSAFREASQQAGVGNRSGRLSAVRTDDAGYAIDPSERARAYGREEYVVGEVHTNTIEGYFSISSAA